MIQTIDLYVLVSIILINPMVCTNQPLLIGKQHIKQVLNKFDIFVLFMLQNGFVKRRNIHAYSCHGDM